MADIKVPLHNTDAEEAVLGSVLIDHEAMRFVEKILTPADFYNESNMELYRACLNVYKRLEAVNQITVAQELSRLGKVEFCGGAARLSYLPSICPTSLDAEYYADIVKRLSIYRQVVDTGKMIVSIAEKQEPDIEKTFECISDQIDKVRKTNLVSKKIVTPTGAADILMEMIEKYNTPGNYISTGFIDLDKVCVGFFPSELTVIGARPSVGKTQIMIDIAENVASQGRKVLFCSVEMKLYQILERKVARELNITVEDIRRKGFNAEQAAKVSDVAGLVSEGNISYLADGTGTKDIYAALEASPPDIVMVDYLQILSDCWGDDESQNIRTGKAMRKLKAMAKAFNVHFVVASQLNRLLELRGDKHPTMSDLRDSGNIEQDADIVWLLYRDDDSPEVMEVKQAKNRQLGSKEAQKILWHAQKRRYVNMWDR
jgi:replicative DNA helicase